MKEKFIIPKGTPVTVIFQRKDLATSGAVTDVDYILNASDISDFYGKLHFIEKYFVNDIANFWIHVDKKHLI